MKLIALIFCFFIAISFVFALDASDVPDATAVKAEIKLSSEQLLAIKKSKEAVLHAINIPNLIPKKPTDKAISSALKFNIPFASIQKESELINDVTEELSKLANVSKERIVVTSVSSLGVESPVASPETDTAATYFMEEEVEVFSNEMMEEEAGDEVDDELDAEADDNADDDASEEEEEEEEEVEITTSSEEPENVNSKTTESLTKVYFTILPNLGQYYKEKTAASAFEDIIKAAKSPLSIGTRFLSQLDGNFNIVAIPKDGDVSQAEAREPHRIDPATGKVYPRIRESKPVQTVPEWLLTDGKFTSPTYNKDLV